MKKILLMMISLSLFSTTATAEVPDLFDFVISLKNMSSYDCVLAKQQTIYGTVKHNNSVPDVLFQGQTMSFVMQKQGVYQHDEDDILHGDLHDSLIILTYQCGDDQSITLLSHRAPHKSYIRDRQIRGLVLEKKNLNANFKTHLANLFNPAKISWVITNVEEN